MASLPQESTTAGWLRGGGRSGGLEVSGEPPARAGPPPRPQSGRSISASYQWKRRARPRQPAARWARPRCSARRRAFGKRP